MQKIPTIFERDWDGDRSRVLDVPVPEAAWVFAGEGIATRKYDGSCCLVRAGVLYRRHEVRPRRRTGIVPELPAGFERVSTDEETGAIVGWLPVGNGPEDKWHRDAFSGDPAAPVEPLPLWPDGTYELLGPKVQGNPERFPEHLLVRHSEADTYHPDPPTTFDALKEWLDGRDIEGLVWHHPDGRMAKIKLRDFGLRRP